MNIKSREARKIKIANYLFKGNTYFQAAVHFNISINQLFRINRQFKLAIIEALLARANPPFGNEIYLQVAEQFQVPTQYVVDAVMDFESGKLKKEGKANDVP